MRDNGRWLWGAGLITASLALAVPAAMAEVVARSETGFVVRLASEVTAPPAEAWKTILAPAQWWQSQHTFSGDAANLTLDPQVGGCFCEILPRPDDAPVAQKAGGVQHMRVVYIEPPRAMRLVGALGPLQSEALAATMTITVKPTDTPAGKGSRILFEYVVGGFMRYKVDEIAPAVDRMLAAQLTSLAGKLGPVANPVAAQAPQGGAAMGPAASGEELPAAQSDPRGSGSGAVAPLSGAENYSLPPAPGKPASKQTPKPEAKPATKPAAPASAPAPASVAKPAPVKASYVPVAKPAAAAGLAKVPAKAPPAATARSVAQAAGKPTSKPTGKAAAKAPDPDAEAHRDANAAFDAALSGGATSP